VGYKNNRLFLDKSTWTLATILMLILLSSFTGTLRILILKSLKTGSAAPATNTPAAPANTPAATIQQINYYYNISSKMPACWHFFIRNMSV
jgi:hypothetical protein